MKAAAFCFAARTSMLRLQLVFDASPSLVEAFFIALAL